jgi:cell fate regulator YaaT (PSP1 superfamily)
MACMAAATAQIVVGVRFHVVGKLYHFDSTAYPDVQLGDYVIVETSRGRQLGQIMGFIPPDRVDTPDIKPIKRPASARDLLMRKLYDAKEIEALITCREAASELGSFEAVKFVKADYNYDGSVLSFLYTTEENINTNRLRRHLARKFRSKVEMRRIGARDAAKMLGEYGACGGPRCCSTYLTDFSPISIKMAKQQGISLNPSEITGMCGRLRCCLVYEFEQYVEARKHLPKVRKQVGTPHGEGRVIDVNPLKGTVTVLVGETRHEVHQDDLQPLDELRALQEKAGQGCVKEGGGVCDCGARVRPVRAEASTEDDEQAEKGPAAPPAAHPPAGQEPSAADRDRQQSGRRRSRRRRPYRPDERSH